jgi:hypothetical protein
VCAGVLRSISAAETLTKVLILFVQTIYGEFRLEYGANKSDEFGLWYATYKLQLKLQLKPCKPRPAFFRHAANKPL